MTSRSALQFDEIGYWTELKLEILKNYARAYSTIFNAKKQHRFFHVYIDAFAGAGEHISRKTGKPVPGSPLNALAIEPHFREYHFIDLDPRKVAHLRELIGDRKDVSIHEGDCNRILIERVFPQVKYEDFRRGLCLLDPYGLHLQWDVLRTAGGMKSLDVFLNFPIADIHRNVIWRNPEGVSADDIGRMTAFWGDESWRKIAYQSTPGLFGEMIEKAAHEAVVNAFRERLKVVAGFAHVPDPLPMRNSKRVIVYYLFFASHSAVGEKIARDIFKRYRNRTA